MKDSTIIILVAAGAALIFWAVSSGLIRTTGGAINVGGGVVAPQPSQNYSGYLAASTAPQVSGALNTAISGLSNLFSGWISPSKSSTQVPTSVGQSASAFSPALAAQPSGLSAYADYSNALVGPQVNPAVSYDATSGSAFDWAGLASDNQFDSDYSLQDPYLV